MEDSEGIKNFLTKLNGKKILIFLGNGSKFTTSNHRVEGSGLRFIDKYGVEMFVSFDLVSLIQEVKA